ncbi:MAG: PASTA domain-containing protein [Treponema sp.]|jgi:beta-lactam-binding protein with PASTA domain|nr:PASTA domain-containing protein [Treponema sp.]
MGYDLGKVEEYVTRHLKLFIASIAALLVFMGLTAFVIFTIYVRGAEQTMVPEVRGKELTEALLDLQVKELYPRLQLRYSQISGDKGQILEQNPMPGTIVKAGRRIRLVVSQGVAINKVENFIGRHIDEVRMDIQAIYSPSGGLPLITIKEPVMYDFSSETPGTILAQKPEPGADISGPLSLELVVSRGQENAVVTVPQFAGLDIPKALELIGVAGVNFHFSLKERSGNEKGGTIVYQEPAGNMAVPLNTAVQLTATIPDNLAEGEVFGLFHYTIPLNPYPLTVRLEALLPLGERIRLITATYPGGEFTVPYRLTEGATLVLYMLNRELHRETVRRPDY